MKTNDDLMNNDIAKILRKLYGTHPLCLEAADKIDFLGDEITKIKKNFRNSRDEVGRLHSLIDRLKENIHSLETTLRRKGKDEKNSLPDAWQWKFKNHDGSWSDWHDGKVRVWAIEDGREYEERPLYALDWPCL